MLQQNASERISLESNEQRYVQINALLCATLISLVSDYL